MNKKPGIAFETVVSELDLTYKERYSNINIPEAYESLILGVLRNDQANFVRNDELEQAWKIFTPILHKIEREKIAPEIYPFGSRGPPSADDLTFRCGFVISEKKYEWKSNG
jgi:glucose-6-phosphate 1-dehydrogenase